MEAFFFTFRVVGKMRGERLYFVKKGGINDIFLMGCHTCCKTDSVPTRCYTQLL